MPEETGVRVWAEPLKAFCVRVFEKLDVPEEDGRIAADFQRMRREAPEFYRQAVEGFGRALSQGTDSTGVS